jgi:hypothetical protein
LLNLIENSKSSFIASLYRKLDIPLWFPVALEETNSYTSLESQMSSLFNSLAFDLNN